MVGTGVLRDAKLGTEEGASDFGDKLFGGVSGIAETLPEFTGEALFRTAPMTLMPISA